MKKTAIILLSMLLVLVVGQGVFAKGSVAIGGGYEVFANSNFNANGLNLNLSANYYFTDHFSLSAGLDAVILFDEGTSTRIYNINLFARYDLLKTDVATIGLQLGFIDSIISRMPNCLYIGPGAYANFKVAPKLNIYTDIKLPIGVIAKDANIPFIAAYHYNVKLGVIYEVSPKINIGLEASITNCNLIGLMTTLRDNAANNFSIGAKVGYSF